MDPGSDREDGKLPDVPMDEASAIVVAEMLDADDRAQTEPAEPLLPEGPSAAAQSSQSTHVLVEAQNELPFERLVINVMNVCEPNGVNIKYNVKFDTKMERVTLTPKW